MGKAKVIKVEGDVIHFDNGMQLYSNHEQDCCENHSLDLTHTKVEDFEGLEFDLTEENFFKRIPDYGIELVPVHGHSVKIPGYGSNNGYYSANIDLVLTNNSGFTATYDISECQDY